MNTTKNQVMDYLQWSSEQYEGRYFQSFWTWCQNYGQYPSVIQQLLANRQVNAWFNYEFGKLEHNFIKIYEACPNASVQVLENHYKAATASIITIYPKPLLEQVKRNREFSNIYVTNTPIYYAN